jgi:2-oxoglutarate ferredoxin oxidoreductase subunit beta
VAFGTGAYLGNKNLKVIVISGDGDLVAIGGNHLIHAARRNLPLTVICANNSIYGMTGGQVAPTTPLGGCTLTSPWGSDEPAFDLCRLVEGAGAKFVGRHTVFQIHQLIKTLSLALKFNGFSFVEVISPCPTHYGKLNDIPTLADFRRIMKDQYLDRRRWEKLSAEDQQKTIPTGVLVNIPQNEKPESSPGKGERVKAEGGK